MSDSESGSGVHLVHDPSFLNEIWAWFIIGCVTIALRYIVRIRTVGFRGFEGDDYVTIGTLIFYTMDAVLVHIVYHTGANADLTPDIVEHLNDHQISTLVLGSRCETAAWYSYTALIWCMKFTMLFFYKRLTIGTWQNRLIKYLFYLCGITYIAVFLTITFGCYPIQHNWQVKPLPGKQCTFKVQNLLVTVTLNVITDAFILFIPIPMLWRLKVSWARKLLIAVFLSSGVFVIAAAVIRAVLTLGAAPSALNINRWGVRETIIGLLTVNVPILRPLFTRAFWRRGPYVPSAQGGMHSSHWSAKPRNGGKGGSAGTFELRSSSGESKEVSSVSVERRSDSQEHIIPPPAVGGGRKSGPGRRHGRSNSHVVVIEQTYDIVSSARDEEASIGQTAEVVAGGGGGGGQGWRSPGGRGLVGGFSSQVVSGR